LHARGTSEVKTWFCWEDLMAREHLEDLGVDRLLKWIFRKSGGEAWPALFWF
jgi:hypothetical protein